MSRKKQPLRLAILKGATKKNPQRYADIGPEPETGELGEPPSTLSEELQAIWREIVEQVHPSILQRSDRLTLEMFCRCIHSLRSNKEFISSQHQRFQGYAASFGMSPADRQRVPLKTKPKPGSFSEFV